MTSARILVVDDTPAIVKLLVDLLSVNGFDVVAASSGTEGLERAAADAPDLVLLDVMMPDLDGFAVCERLKAHAATRDVPVIFITALNEALDKVRAFSTGGVDYLTKPFEPRELLARVSTHLALRRARRELEEQNARLRAEIEAHGRSRAVIGALEDEIRTGHDFREIVGRSPRLVKLLDDLALVAATGSTVLVLGETGTGKELIARAIHDRSPRRERALVKVNCAALPRELVESELFGHEKGAFTGATQQRRGRFELADGGTLFLDEVGELPLEAQAKLLRVLQEQEFERVGGTRALRTDVRVIAATNRDLGSRAAAGEFRADLYYRLNVFPVTVPALRERREDIPLLVGHFLGKAARKLGKSFDGASPAFLERAAAYDWPGNVRELENAVERAAILARGPVLDSLEPFGAMVPVAARAGAQPETPAGSAALADVERAHIERVLGAARWVIEGERGAARVLGLNASTLRGRMRKLGIRKPR
ncbi:MAG: sigma-54 dependent transcriptional regulator [Burkholderiales bacterium]